MTFRSREEWAGLLELGAARPKVVDRRGRCRRKPAPPASTEQIRQRLDAAGDWIRRRRAGQPSRQPRLGAGREPDRPQGEVEPLPPPKPKRAKAEPTRAKRDPVIEGIKALYPLDGIHPKSVSIAALTRRINKLPEFKENPVSEDTVGRADEEIKAARKK